MSDRYVYVVNWWKFQHYKDRNPPWIKCYTELLSNEAYTNLSGHLRGCLHGIWMEYSMSAQQLPVATRTLTRRLSLRVTTADLTSLVQAGFIRILDSKALAKRLQADSKALSLARARGRSRAPSREAEGSTKDKTPPKVEGSPETQAAAALPDLHRLGQDLETEIVAAPRGTDGRLYEVLVDGDKNTAKVIGPLLEKLPASAIEVVREEVLAANGDKRGKTGYAVRILQRMVDKQLAKEAS
jgi:hypothetical protein